MEKPFDEALLFRKLEELVRWKQLVFGISICNRLLPNFVIFAEENNVNGASELELSLKKAWENIFSGEINVDERYNAELCESVAPDTEDYESILVSSALDAAVSISLLMRAFTEADVQPIVDMATLARDSVDMYVQDVSNLEPNDLDLERKILHHPLMQNELTQQRLDLKYLTDLSDNLKVEMPEIKNRWFNKYKSCLGLQH